MTKPIARDPMYRKRVFDADIIELCVRWYITYRLSYRDLVEMMAERGVKVAHSTILRWVTRLSTSAIAVQFPLCTAIYGISCTSIHRARRYADEQRA
jgi:hypothetical protein